MTDLTDFDSLDSCPLLCCNSCLYSNPGTCHQMVHRTALPIRAKTGAISLVDASHITTLKSMAGLVLSLELCPSSFSWSSGCTQCSLSCLFHLRLSFRHLPPRVLFHPLRVVFPTHNGLHYSEIFSTSMRPNEVVASRVRSVSHGEMTVQSMTGRTSASICLVDIMMLVVCCLFPLALLCPHLIILQ